MTKTFTFAILHFTVAFSVAYLLTGSIAIGGAVALIEPAINTVAFHFHEKLWKKIEQSPSSVVTKHLLRPSNTDEADSSLFKHHCLMHSWVAASKSSSR